MKKPIVILAVLVMLASVKLQAQGTMYTYSVSADLLTAIQNQESYYELDGYDPNNGDGFNLSFYWENGFQYSLNGDNLPPQNGSVTANAPFTLNFQDPNDSGNSPYVFSQITNPDGSQAGQDTLDAANAAMSGGNSSFVVGADGSVLAPSVVPEPSTNDFFLVPLLTLLIFTISRKRLSQFPRVSLLASLSSFWATVVRADTFVPMNTPSMVSMELP